MATFDGISVKLSLETIEAFNEIMEKYNFDGKRGSQKDFIDKLVIRKIMALKRAGTPVPKDLLNDVDFVACGLDQE